MKAFFLTVFCALGMQSFGQPATFVRLYSNGNSGFAVREVNGNQYAVAGSTDFYYNFHWQIQSPTFSTNVHFFVASATGTLILERIYAMSGFRTQARWMEPVADGYILCGSRNQDAVWPPDSNDVILIKTNAAGIIQWSKVFDSGKDELGFCVKPTIDGGYILSCFHDSVPSSLAGNTCVMLIKTDAAGNIQWEKKYFIAVRDFDTGEALPCAVAQTADSGYVVTGTTAASHQADVFIFRTNATGTLLWAKSYEHSPGTMRLSTGGDVLEASSGDIIVAGSMDKDRPTMQFNYPYTLRVSANGTLLDAGLYDSNPASMFQSGFSSVQQTPDGGFLFTGMGGYSGFGDQAQILKTNASIVPQWSRVYTMDGLATVGTRSGRLTSDGGYVFTGKRQMDGTILMKTDGSGRIPCKSPGSLTRLLPFININARTVNIASGIGTYPAVFVTMPASLDTSSLCPEESFPLPVELSCFHAAETEQKVNVEWCTASEYNNDFFTVEKSADGKKYFEAGRVNGGGTTTEPKHYSFQDASPLQALLSYYRIRQTDYDGSSQVFPAEAVYASEKKPAVISLQAVEDVIQIHFSAPGEEIVHLQLFDCMGRLIDVQNMKPADGIREVRLGHTLSHGLYSVMIQQGTFILHTKVVY